MAKKIDESTAIALNKQFGMPKGLEPLEDVEKRLDKKYAELHGNKLEILKELSKIYENRTYYFGNKKLLKYLNDFPGYVKDRFGQARSTYYADARVVKMLWELGRQKVLEKSKDDLVNLLRMIPNRGNPRPLLDKIDQLDRESLKQELKDWENRTVGGYELELPILGGVDKLPTEGFSLVVAAEVNNVLYFRVFDKEGKMKVNKDEKGLPPSKKNRLVALKTELNALRGKDPSQDERIRVAELLTKVFDHKIVKKPPEYVDINELEIKVDKDKKGIFISFKDGSEPLEHLDYLKKHLKMIEGKTMKVD